MRLTCDRIFAFLVVLQTIIATCAFADKQVNVITPLHEALLTRVSGIDPLQIINKEPPKNITENIPDKTDFTAEWIPGYWSWSVHHKDFIWISGVFRRPPPDHQWIQGEWKAFDGGWIYLQGFWSSKPLEEIAFNPVMPPQDLEDTTGVAPGGSFFWANGQWIWSNAKEKYVWKKGEWVALDPNCVYVSARYVWRELGYAYLPAYWDWPLDSVGIAYYSDIKAQQSVTSFTPLHVVETDDFIVKFFAHYPYYQSYFFHHHYYNPVFWSAFEMTPPWWSWNDWWSYNWNNQLALFWWYSHPNYPQPMWMTEQVAEKIKAPNSNAVVFYNKMSAPLCVLAKGVVFPQKLFQAYASLDDKNDSQDLSLLAPILPSKVSILKKIRQRVDIDEVKTIIRPHGSDEDAKAVKNQPPKKIVIANDSVLGKKMQRASKLPQKLIFTSASKEKLTVGKEKIADNNNVIAFHPEAKKIQQDSNPIVGLKIVESEPLTVIDDPNAEVIDQWVTFPERVEVSVSEIAAAMPQTVNDDRNEITTTCVNDYAGYKRNNTQDNVCQNEENDNMLPGIKRLPRGAKLIPVSRSNQGNGDVIYLPRGVKLIPVNNVVSQQQVMSLPQEQVMPLPQDQMTYLSQEQMISFPNEAVVMPQDDNNSNNDGYYSNSNNYYLNYDEMQNASQQVNSHGEMYESGCAVGQPSAYPSYYQEEEGRYETNYQYEQQPQYTR